jgi:hypothetical protein
VITGDGENCYSGTRKYEVKTASRKGNDFLFEATPFIHHLDEYYRGVQCDYFWDGLDRRVGIDVGEMKDLIDMFFYSNRTDIEFMGPQITQLCGHIGQCHTEAFAGSGDAFFRILVNKTDDLSSWDDYLIRVLLSAV